LAIQSRLQARGLPARLRQRPITKQTPTGNTCLPSTFAIPVSRIIPS
jgi:hypothetical protein